MFHASREAPAVPVNDKAEVEMRTLLPETELQGGSLASNCVRVDMPRYIDFHLPHRLVLDETVTRRGRLGDVNEASCPTKAGAVARAVPLLD